MPTQQCPKFLRGYFYPTTRVSRCPSFHPCYICHKCRKFTRTYKMCMVCESNYGVQWVCRHNDEDQLAAARITKALNRPMWDPNADPQKAAPPVDDLLEQDLKQLKEASTRGLGQVGDVAEVSKRGDPWKG